MRLRTAFSSKTVSASAPCGQLWPHRTGKKKILVRSCALNFTLRGGENKKTKPLLRRDPRRRHKLPAREGGTHFVCRSAGGTHCHQWATTRPTLWPPQPPPTADRWLSARGEQVLTRFNGPWPEHKGKKKKEKSNNVRNARVTPCTPTSPARSPRARAPAEPAAGSRSTCTCPAPSA